MMAREEKTGHLREGSNVSTGWGPMACPFHRSSCWKGLGMTSSILHTSLCCVTTDSFPGATRTHSQLSGWCLAPQLRKGALALGDAGGTLREGRSTHHVSPTHQM